MKTLTSYFAFLTLSTVLAQTTNTSLPQQCLDPPRDSCAFYTDCLESNFHCGESGYPVGYGAKYCAKFSDERDLLSAQGVEWMINTMSCLQHALVPFLTSHVSSQTDSTCDDLEDVAFDSHSDCYVQNGLCDLPPSDWFNIAFKIVGIDSLVESWDSIRESLEAAEGCAALWLFLQNDVKPEVQTRNRERREL